MPSLPDDTNQSLEQALLALGWPSFGTSAEGRPLPARRFGPSGAPALVLVAGVHGNEPTSVEATLELVPWLEGVPLARPVWVVPVLNPDGLVRNTKDSARGVDLNRNFPARNFSTDHPPGYFPGAAPLSEPETQAFARLLAREPLGGIVAVHAPFACVNYDGPARAWAERVAAACGWPARGDIGYPTPGSLGSWIGLDRGLPILTLELPPGPYAPYRGKAQAALQTAINPENFE